jgi:hypothetical protein
MTQRIAGRPFHGGRGHWRRQRRAKPLAEFVRFFADLDEARAYLDGGNTRASGAQSRLAEFARELLRKRTAGRICAYLTDDLAKVLDAAAGRLLISAPAVANMVGVGPEHVCQHLASILDDVVAPCSGAEWLCIGAGEPAAYTDLPPQLSSPTMLTNSEALVHADPRANRLDVVLWGVDQAIGLLRLRGAQVSDTATTQLVTAIGQTAGMLLCQAIQIEGLRIAGPRRL